MEIWKAVKDYPRYEVSSLGRFRKDGTKIRKWDYSSDKYLIVRLRNEHGYINKAIHVLVIEAFIKRPNYKCEVNHKDCNRSNNCIENLEYVTHKQNLEHAEFNGRMDYRHRTGKDHPSYGKTLPSEVINNMRAAHNKNGDHPNYVLTDSQVCNIKQRRFNGESIESLAIEFNQSKANISLICKGKRRSKIAPEYTMKPKNTVKGSPTMRVKTKISTIKRGE
jgi:hypothetical protein